MITSLHAHPEVRQTLLLTGLVQITYFRSYATWHYRQGTATSSFALHSEGGDKMTNTEKVQDAAEAARRARFGRLPERIRLEDTIQEVPATAPDPAKDTYNPDEWLIRNAPL
jgi:hypothetical protein